MNMRLFGWFHIEPNIKKNSKMSCFACTLAETNLCSAHDLQQTRSTALLCRSVAKQSCGSVLSWWEIFLSVWKRQGTFVPLLAQRYDVDRSRHCSHHMLRVAFNRLKAAHVHSVLAH